MYIKRLLLDNIIKLIEPQKVIVVYGARRCGKTTLLNHLVEVINEPYLLVNGEDISIQEFLSSQSIEKLKSFVGEKRFLIIDEAQRIRNVGINLKLLVDTIPGIKIIATGSSSFDLAKNLGEPLTGRKFGLRLFPISQMELNSIENSAETKSRLEDRLIFGTYPEVVTTNDREKRILYLKEIVNSYLLKDILELDGIRNSDKLLKLLQLLVFQIGKEVSLNELGTQLGMSKNTVERYLDLLEKVFVIFKLRAFSRNLRKEISKSNRYYFCDNGIRNTLINNFNPLTIRDDTGLLWENYIICERIKKQEYKGISTNNYFWRTYDKKEIDFIEEHEGVLYGYEIKWSEKIKQTPADWVKAYKDSVYNVVTKDNYLDFIA